MECGSEGEFLLKQLKKFISGVTSSPPPKDHLELVNVAISTLKSTPGAREAVFEYFKNIMLQFVSNFLNNSQASEAPLLSIKDTLNEFLSANAEAWTPIIFKWSLDLLGQASQRDNIKIDSQPNVNDRLQTWMNCAATQILVALNKRCLTFLMEHDNETIGALLDMNAKHSPNFDWVIVIIGSSFPESIITRVLFCGLKDFSACDLSDQSTKLNSVVSILGHLAITHFNKIQNELWNLFQWSLENTDVDKTVKLQRAATVPYILHLSSMSSLLLRAISQKTLQSLNVEKLNSLSSLAVDWWCYFPKGRQGMLNMMVVLLLKLEEGFYAALILILEAASSSSEGVSNNAQEIIELLIAETDVILSTTTIIPPWCKAIQRDIRILQRLSISEKAVIAKYATLFIDILGKYSQHSLSLCLSHLLQNASAPHIVNNLKLLVRNGVNIKFFGETFLLCTQMENDPEQSKIMWGNILELLECEKTYEDALAPVFHGLWDHFDLLIECFLNHHTDVETSSIIAVVIDDILQQTKARPLPFSTTSSLADAALLTFCTYCLMEGGENCDDWLLLKHLWTLHDIFFKLCCKNASARNYLLRSLVEIALYAPTSQIFGAVAVPDEDTKVNPEYMLLKENLKHGNNLMVAQSAMSTFHNGIIGNGLRKMPEKCAISMGTAKRNVGYFVAALRVCCKSLTGEGEMGDVMVESAANVSLLMVHLISPDVMFNGLPWPEEEFCKVTMERDLAIRKTFNNTPILWALLKFIAAQRPTLCYCSVLLRAITATLIYEWTALEQNRATTCTREEVLATTTKLLEIMNLGQLLPFPLNGIKDVIPYLEARDVILILRESLWSFMHHHVPTPALFSRDANGKMQRTMLMTPGKKFTDPMRLVMLRNIEKLSDWYRLFFVVADPPEVN